MAALLLSMALTFAATGRAALANVELPLLAPISDELKTHLFNDAIKLDFVRQMFAQATYNPNCLLREMLLIPMYYWPDNTVELTCFVCDPSQLTNGLEKVWRMTSFKGAYGEEPTYQNPKMYEDVAKMNIEEAHYRLPVFLGRYFRPVPRFLQRDGKLTIFHTGLETQGFYNCYDKETKEEVQWTYVLIAMTPPALVPCYSFWMDPDIEAENLLFFCNQRHHDANVQECKHVKNAYCILKGNYCWEPLRDTSSVSERVRDARIDVLEHIEMSGFDDYLRDTKDKKPHNIFSLLQPVVAPIEMWHTFFIPVESHPVVHNFSMQFLANNFAIYVKWTEWSPCSACKPYSGVRTREGHCYIRKLNVLQEITTHFDAPPAGRRRFLEHLIAKRLLYADYYAEKLSKALLFREKDLIYAMDLPELARIDHLLSLPVFSGEGLPLHGGHLVDILCGHGKGLPDCFCMTNFTVIMLLHLPKLKVPDAPEPYRSYGIIPCYDYALTDMNAEQPYSKLPKTYKLKDGSLFHNFGEVKPSKLVFPVVGGYYIETSNCEKQCEIMNEYIA